VSQPDNHPPDERYVVSLEVFEGPLDLLLHLIRRHEIDVFDIPIAFVTRKYLEYLDLMQDLNLDLAAEYLEMAATLLHIKSRMMVPSPNEGEDELVAPEDGPDPREELVRQLLEYQKYKVAAEQLAAMPRRGRDTFPRGAPVEASAGEDGPGLASPGLYALLEALQQVLARAGTDATAEISVTRISISARIRQLLDQVHGSVRVAFRELFGEHVTRSEVVVTFLALLEMTRLGLTRVHQAGPGGEIHITPLLDASEAARVLSGTELEDR
jgi:segregation and condensation protein A